MIEPLLGIALPNEIVMPGKYHRAGDSGETVVVLQQVFDNVRGQENIAAVCRLCATQAGIRLVAVEGANDELRPSLHSKSVSEWIALGSAVSAGVLHLQQAEPDLVDVWGVDEMGLNRRSQSAMIAVMQNAGTRDRAFDLLRPSLDRNQTSCYGADVAATRASMLSVYNRRRPITEQATLLKKAAERVGLDLRSFPLIRRFDELLAKEHKINSLRVKTQTVRFVTRLHKRLFNWFERAGKNQIHIDLEKAKPVLEYWMEATGVTPDEMDSHVERRGLESTLLECKQWLDTFVIGEARKQSSAEGGNPHVFYEEMMRLALRLGVDYFDLRDFREMIAMNRDLEMLKRGLADEMAVASRSLVEKLCQPRASEFLEIEELLELFYRGLRLEVPPSEAEAAEIGAGKLRPVLDKLRRLGEVPLPEHDDFQRLDDALGDAATFLQLSRKRSQHMANRTLELMRERGEDRAVLVVGGFHERAITRALEDARGVSWSVLSPSVDLSEINI